MLSWRNKVSSQVSKCRDVAWKRDIATRFWLDTISKLCNLLGELPMENETKTRYIVALNKVKSKLKKLAAANGIRVT